VTRRRSRISDAEIEYLCAAASEYFATPVKRSSIVWTYSGVRPLYDDGASAAQEATRDYVLKPDPAEGAPLINIFGGKITTYRKLSESMLELIEERLGRKSGRWTHRAALPGGDFAADGFDREVSRLQQDYMGGQHERIHSGDRSGHHIKPGDRV
jgi:glycerol-3-phosphate dehydrogenase